MARSGAVDAMKDTSSGGNEPRRELCGDPGANRTSDDDTRDQSLAISRAEAAEQQVKEDDVHSRMDRER